MIKTAAVTRQNPWWKGREIFKKYDKDLQEYKKKKIKYNRKSIDLKLGNIYLVRGPRQSGKTVWIKKAINTLLTKKDPRRIFYLSCDSLLSGSRRELRGAINFFLDQSRDLDELYLFLDEITYAEGWQYELKNLADQGELSRMCIVLTGSSPVTLRDKIELLPGRGAEGNEYFLKPLSFREFVLQTAGSERNLEYLGIEDGDLKASLYKLGETLDETRLDLDKISEKPLRRLLPFLTELQFLFDIYLKTGGFPAAINNYVEHKLKSEERIDPNLYERFIRVTRGDLKREDICKRLFSNIKGSLGQRTSFSSLGEDLSYQTISRYVEEFRKALLIQILYSYDLKKEKQRPKANKKLYFTDPFIFHSINVWLQGVDGYRLSQEFLRDREKKSRLVEGVLASHLARTKEIPYIREQPTFLWFFYDQKGEINAVYRKNNGKYMGLECKYSHMVSSSEIYQIPAVDDFLVLTLDEFNWEGLKKIPISLFLSTLELSEHNL